MPVRGTITKIHPKKYSRNGGAFIRVEFRLADGSWAKTDLVPDFRNFQRWKEILKFGADLDGLELKSKHEVNADSYPRIFKETLPGRYVIKDDGTAEFIQEVPDEIKPIEPIVPVLKQAKLL